MKIGAISDLHVDRHPKLEQDEYLNVLSQVIQHRKLDILLIAGDISNDYQMSYHFIKQLKDNIIFRHTLYLGITTYGQMILIKHLLKF